MSIKHTNINNNTYIFLSFFELQMAKFVSIILLALITFVSTFILAVPTPLEGIYIILPRSQIKCPHFYCPKISVHFHISTYQNVFKSKIRHFIGVHNNDCTFLNMYVF